MCYRAGALAIRTPSSATRILAAHHWMWILVFIAYLLNWGRGWIFEVTTVETTVVHFFNRVYARLLPSSSSRLCSTAVSLAALGRVFCALQKNTCAAGSTIYVCNGAWCYWCVISDLKLYGWYLMDPLQNKLSGLNVEAFHSTIFSASALCNYITFSKVG